MKTYSINLTAGVDKLLNIPGKFMYLLETVDPISLQFRNVHGQRNGEFAEDVEAGYNVRPVGGFGAVELLSATTQTIRIAVTAGEGDYNRTISTVSGSVAVNNLPDQYITYGASYKSNTPLAANTPETIVAPAANLNGLIVWVASFISSQSGATRFASCFLAKTSAPTTIYDGDVIVQPSHMVSQDNGAFLMRPVFIPAGKGLYYIANLAENAAGCLRSCLYSLLP